MTQSRLIGVFDSGVGGLSVAKAIQSALPQHHVLYREDKENLPYGTKSPHKLLTLVEPILQQMVKDGCEVIVIACNTVTTTIISKLRKKINVPLVGIEPMVKPAAALTKSKVIAVCATPTTLASDRYKELKKIHAKGIKVLEPDCGDWALMVQQYHVDTEKIRKRIDYVLNKNADVIVLGCTHYHWIEKLIDDLAEDRAMVLQPEQAIIDRLKTVLIEL